MVDFSWRLLPPYFPMPLEPVNTVQPLSVVEAIARQAEVRPDAVALRAVCGTGIRYRRLQQICQRLGQWVAAEGVTEDDIVVLAMPDGPELAAAFLGVAGVARCLVLPPATGRREVASLFDWLQPRLVLTLAETVATTTADVAAAWQIPAVPLSRMTTSPDDCCRPKGVTHLGSESVSKSQRLPSPDRTAWLAMTSGTTGTPKLVPLSHAQLLAATNRVVNAFGLGPSDRSLSIMPLAHAHGLIASLLAPLVSGGEVICAPGFVATEFFHRPPGNPCPHPAACTSAYHRRVAFYSLVVCSLSEKRRAAARRCLCRTGHRNVWPH